MMIAGKKIIIDGTVGAGKTTCILGVSSANRSSQKYHCFSDEDYNTTGEAIRVALAELKKQGLEQPIRDDINAFFDLALEKSVDMYNQANKYALTIFERGMPYLKLLAEHLNHVISNKYYEYCDKYKYSSPVFILAPISSFDMRIPAAGEEPTKKYTLEQRLTEHKKLITIYQDLGYKVIEVPVFTEKNIEENNIKRINMIKEYLKLL
jgi:predicted ATPase